MDPRNASLGSKPGSNLTISNLLSVDCVLYPDRHDQRLIMGCFACVANDELAAVEECGKFVEIKEGGCHLLG